MAQSIPATNNGSFSLYKNPIQGIKILYPSFWEKFENKSSSDKNGTLTNVVRFSPPHKNGAELAATLDIKLDNISGIKSITLANYSEEITSDLGQDFKVAESNVTLAGYPAYKLLYTGLENNVDLQAMMVITLKDGMAYIINYTAEPEQYSHFLPTVQRMLDSFKILK